LSGVPFEDERVKFPEWTELKPKTPFGQLPVMSIDNGPLRAQSGAMLRWIGAELAPSLYPKDKILDVEEAIGLIEDFGTARAPALYVNMRPENFGHPADWSKTEEGQATVKALRAKVVTELLPKYAAYITALLEKTSSSPARTGRPSPTASRSRSCARSRWGTWITSPWTAWMRTPPSWITSSASARSRRSPACTRRDFTRVTS
jgi:glutathione S-transferase